MKTNSKKHASLSNANMLALLNQSLAELIALKLNAKQAHWNVKGKNFQQLHELFDQVATEADGFADLVAERVVQLGGIAEGTIAHLNKRASDTTYPAVQESEKHVKLIAGAVTAAAMKMRAAIDTSAEHSDQVSADIFTEITRGLDKLAWFVSSHQA
ncbi:MAG: DNA starvation/stationary phase protection protein Dps [Alphaproteobacteria bacterium]|nr:DNA starvation/stationary phase protection protein Dps [Alphaproteobacteria bacterium]